MILAAHQPQFLPWLGYFDKIARADAFVLMDDVQFKKNEWQNRNRVKSARGPVWVTVPVLHEAGQAIAATRLNETAPWRRKNLATLRQCLGAAPHFGALEGFFSRLHDDPWKDLGEINIFCVKELCSLLDIKTPFHLSSTLRAPGAATERLVNLCKALGADTYLSGAGGHGYLELDLFEKAGIRVLFQEYEHPVYSQLHGAFTPNLSVVDLMANAGPRARDIVLRKAAA
jgi:hypothetical protein